MAIINRPIVNGECGLDVRIGVRESLANALAAAGMVVPAPISVHALIDTGAGISCIDLSIPAILGLISTNRIVVSTAFGPSAGQPCDTYRISLSVTHPGGNPADELYRPAWMVACLPIAHTGANVLIGSDLLDECDFHRDGPQAMFWLGY